MRKATGTPHSACTLMLALAACLATAPASQAAPVDVQEAIAWYDTLGYPNAKELAYVRVATGAYSIIGNQPPQNNYVEGFLLHEEADVFTVFICSVSEFKGPFEHEIHPQLTTVRFVRKIDVPAHKRVDYERLDFKNIASEVLGRVSAQATRPFPGLRWGQPLSHRARIFAFARACQQEGEPEVASVLMDLAANIPDEQTGKVNPGRLRGALQSQIGEAILEKAEKDCWNPATSWEDLLKVYADFDTRFPASPRLAYAREAAEILRRMIAEETAHHPQALEQMSPDEKVAENIYQLRNLGDVMWAMHEPYPIHVFSRDGRKEVTPVHRLVDLGLQAVPQLLEALDDRRFTHCRVDSFHGQDPPQVMRVCDLAQRILEHLSGRNFYPKTRDRTREEAAKEREVAEALANLGLSPPEWRPIVLHSTRELAEAWWKEVRGTSEKEALIKTVSAGEQQGYMAARKLVAKYPDAALAAIETGMRASKHDGTRGQFVEAASLLPGEMPVAFLRSQLTPGHGLYSQVRAAKALHDRGHYDVVATMIEAWRKMQPRLPMNDADAYGEAGALIGFLARSGDATAIDALWQEGKKDPVEVRRAIVSLFMLQGMSGGGNGESVSSMGPPDPVKGPEDAIQRLLVAALDDTERRFALDLTNTKVALHDPRICDLAALALSQRWPKKYPFEWTANVAQCDARIATLRNQWREENGLPAITAPPPITIPAVRESDVAPLLDEFATGDQARRDALAAKIADTFGLGALPVVRARWEKTKDAAFRSLAINLAGRVREVRIVADVGDGAKKSHVTLLQGEALTGARLYQLAYELQSALPAEARAVHFLAERSGDGAGFVVTVQWFAGQSGQYKGWKRDMVVRSGDQSLLADVGGWMAEGAMKKEAIYERFGDAFEKAIQSDIDAPITTRLRIQRGNAGSPP